MKKIILVSSMALACALPAVSHAESNTTTPAVSGSTATGRLDFTVVVPSVLFLRIGTGGAVGSAAVATVDSLVFTVPSTNVGDGTVVGGTGGDLTGVACAAEQLTRHG